MAEGNVCSCDERCPLQRAILAIGGKWKMSIICMLSADGTTRFNDIKRKLSGVSNTMLVKSLKELEDDGLVRRHEYLEVPVRVEYEVTDAARSLLPVLTELAKWGSGLRNVRVKSSTTSGTSLLLTYLWAKLDPGVPANNIATT